MAVLVPYLNLGTGVRPESWWGSSSSKTTHTFPIDLPDQRIFVNIGWDRTDNFNCTILVWVIPDIISLSAVDSLSTQALTGGKDMETVNGGAIIGVRMGPKPNGIAWEGLTRVIQLQSGNWRWSGAQSGTADGSPITVTLPGTGNMNSVGVVNSFDGVAGTPGFDRQVVVGVMTSGASAFLSDMTTLNVSGNEGTRFQQTGSFTSQAGIFSALVTVEGGTPPPPEEPSHPLGNVGLTFAEEYRTSYRDWESVTEEGEDFSSYFISGYKLHADASKKFQSNYITVNYEPRVTGSAFIQGVWDYALGNTLNDGDSRSDTGRWGSHQEIYGPTNNTDYKHAFRKLKIRGHGRALQLKVKSQTGKPFFLNGWSMFVTGNSIV